MIGLIIFGGLVVIGWLLARVTGALQFYSIPTPSNEPTLKVGSTVFTSNLKQPLPGNIVAYKNEYSEPGYEYPKPGETHLFRMVADEGNVIEMKDAVLFLNGKNFDADKNLLQNYIVNQKLATEIFNKAKETDENTIQKISDISYQVFLTSNEANEYKRQGFTLDQIIYKKGIEDFGAFKWMKNDFGWTMDNFGPLKIPKGHFFVLGDNRHNALDSRFVGFIKKENFRGTVLGK